jgi:hypothetical protein
MNTHYENAVGGLRRLDEMHMSGTPVTEAGALAKVSILASLAVAEEQAKTNKQLELANLIAYAHMRRERRRISLVAEKLVDSRMAAVFPEIADELDDDDQDLDL